MKCDKAHTFMYHVCISIECPYIHGFLSSGGFKHSFTWVFVSFFFFLYSRYICDKVSVVATMLQSITFFDVIGESSVTSIYVRIRCQCTKEKANVPTWPSLKSNIKWWIGEIVKFVWKFTKRYIGCWCHTWKWNAFAIINILCVCVFLWNMWVKEVLLDEAQWARYRFLGKVSHHMEILNKILSTIHGIIILSNHIIK